MTSEKPAYQPVAFLDLQALVGIVGFGLGVRLLSRRRFIPCPWWLDWLLENPYMETAAHWVRSST